MLHAQSGHFPAMTGQVKRHMTGCPTPSSLKLGRTIDCEGAGQISDGMTPDEHDSWLIKSDMCLSRCVCMCVCSHVCVGVHTCLPGVLVCAGTNHYATVQIQWILKHWLKPLEFDMCLWLERWIRSVSVWIDGESMSRMLFGVLLSRPDSELWTFCASRHVSMPSGSNGSSLDLHVCFGQRTKD